LVGANGRSRIASGWLPGKATPLAVGAKKQRVLVEGGAMWSWTPQGWRSHGTGFGPEAVSSCSAWSRRDEPQAALDGTARFRVLRAMSFGPLLGDRFAGDIVTLNEREAMPLLRSGVVARAGDAAPTPAEPA
jgi:hypothetical protein